jgi:hypothetical protein
VPDGFPPWSRVSRTVRVDRPTQLGREECRPGPKEGEVVWTPFPAT